MKLILAQGNPAPEYKKTRHNTGFLILDAFADQHGATWKASDKFHSDMAEVTIEGKKVLLVKPSTYYNETGRAARTLIDFYKLDPSEDLLVIHDDLSLPVGTVRIRQKGSDAGNNGIKSLNQHVGVDYWRLRTGIWSELRDRMQDADFVLSKFNRSEEKSLQDSIIPHAAQLITAFINNTLSVHSTQL